MRATLPSTRRSDETSLLMNAKPSRSRSRNSGVTRMPSWPQTTVSPALHVAQLAARGRRAVDDDHRVHALLVDLDPAAAQANVRAMVGGRVEVVRDAAILLGRLQNGVAPRGRMSAERRELLQQIVERRLVGDGDAHLDARRVVVGPADVEREDLVGRP